MKRAEAVVNYVQGLRENFLKWFSLHWTTISVGQFQMLFDLVKISEPFEDVSAQKKETKIKLHQKKL